MNQPALKATPSAKRLGLADVKAGRIEVPIKLLGYGPEGVGKSTFASGAPKPIFLNFDQRTSDLDVERLTPSTFADALEYIGLLEREQHAYRTVVVDPLSWLEPLIHEHVMGGPGNIDKFDGGYGRGASAALDQWRILVVALDRLWRRGMNVLLLAHAVVKRFDDPEGMPYDRYELSMKANAAGLLRQWVDYVLFMRHETYVKRGDDRRAKGFATGARVAHTSWAAAYDAKRARSVPDEIPLSWEEFAAAHETAGKQVDELRAQIAGLIEAIGDLAVTKKATGHVASIGNNAARLTELANALTSKLHQVQQTKESGT